MARSYLNQPLSTTYNSLEKSKKAKYNERILNVEHGTFTPLILLVSVDWELRPTDFTTGWAKILPKNAMNQLALPSISFGQSCASVSYEAHLCALGEAEAINHKESPSRNTM